MKSLIAILINQILLRSCLSWMGLILSRSNTTTEAGGVYSSAGLINPLFWRGRLACYEKSEKIVVNLEDILTI